MPKRALDDKDGRRISALVRCTLGCVGRGLLRPYNLAHNIRSHAEQTYDRKQVHEKAHEGTLLVSGTTKLMRGRENNRDPGHICGGSQNDWRAIWPREFLWASRTLCGHVKGPGANHDGSAFPACICRGGEAALRPAAASHRSGLQFKSCPSSSQQP